MLDELIINNNHNLTSQYQDKNCKKTNYRLLKNMSLQNNKLINNNNVIFRESNELNNSYLNKYSPFNFDQNFTNSNKNENQLYITHVTLKLDVLNRRPLTSHTWRYNSIRKNIFSSNVNNFSLNSNLISSK